MSKTSYTLKTIKEDEKFNLFVSFSVYNRMVEYLKIHNYVFDIINTEKCQRNEEETLTLLSRNITLQFESSKYYYKMVEELVNSIDKTNINKN